MEYELEKLSNRELIDMYLKNKEFINFLEKEQKNAEKMRDEKWKN